MRNIKKYILGIVFIIIIVNIFYILNFNVSAITLSEMEGAASSFLSKGETEMGDLSTDLITQEFVGLGQILTMIGAGVMVAVTAFMGIKYITASPEGQAKLKQQLIGVLVSAIVIFGAYNIWKLVVNIVSNF